MIKIDEDLMNNIAGYMFDDYREQVHRELAPCKVEVFLKRYVELDQYFAELLWAEFGIDVDELETVDTGVEIDE